jgi:uncharacterized protein (DUF4213/DUF364 family)
MMKSGDNFLYGRFHNKMKEHMNIKSHWNLKSLFIKLFYDSYVNSSCYIESTGTSMNKCEEVRIYCMWEEETRILMNWPKT